MPRRRKNYKKKYRNKKKNQRLQNFGDKEVIYTGTPKMQPVIYKGIGIPPVFCTKLKWNYKSRFTGAFNTKLFRANSAYDPDYVSAPTGSAMYFAELSQLYNRYCVIASSIVVTFMNNLNSTEGANCKFGVYPLNDIATTLSIREMTERDNCAYAHIGVKDGDQGIVTIKHYANIAQASGKARDENTDDVMSAPVTTNPNRSLYWHVAGGTFDGSTVCDVIYDVTIVYYVKFYERIDVASTTY